jgi:hypothetical protein
MSEKKEVNMTHDKMVAPALNNWNVCERQCKDGQWFLQIIEGFNSEREGRVFISTHPDKRFDLLSRKQIIKDSQYKPTG